MDYITVFEITDKGFEIVKLTPLIFVIIGVGISWFNIKYNKSTSPKRILTIVFGFIFSGFASIMLLLTVPNEIANWNRTQKIFANKEYKVIEGEIHDFHPMPYSGHEDERFTVKGVLFEYSDYSRFYGFNNTSSHGGPLKENGQQVRLSYITVYGENRILKIELKP